MAEKRKKGFLLPPAVGYSLSILGSLLIRNRVSLRYVPRLLITLAINPYQTFAGPLVRTRELYVGHADGLPHEPHLAGGVDSVHDRVWAVGGMVRGMEPQQNTQLTPV